MWSSFWHSGVFRGPGNKIEWDLSWPNEVCFKAAFEPFQFEDGGEKQYSIMLHIKRTAQEMEMKVPYTIDGEFEFSGTIEGDTQEERIGILKLIDKLESINEKKSCKHIFPFKCTITHSKCTFYAVSLMVPVGDNDMWPSCTKSRITVRTRVLPDKNRLSNQLYANGHFDLWVCGADGKAFGLHQCVALTLWKGKPITMTTKDKPFNLRVGNEPSLRYLIERMYQLTPSTLKLLCWKQVFLLTIVLQYESILEEVESQFIKAIQGHPHKMHAIGPICKEFPSVKAFQQLKIKIIKQDMKAYIEMMDQNEKDKEKSFQKKNAMRYVLD